MRITSVLFCIVALSMTWVARAQTDSSPADSAESLPVEDLLLGSWKVADREFDFENTTVRQTDGVIHITERLPDGTYLVLVTISSHVSNKDGSDRPLSECGGEKECVRAGATEGIGVYSNGRFLIDYFGENWIDDVFTISGTTMRGRDLNGPIHLTKSARSAK